MYWSPSSGSGGKYFSPTFNYRAKGTQTYTGSTEELFWSENNVIYGSGAPFEIDASCEDGTWSSSGATAVTDDPSLTLMPYDAAEVPSRH
jgi:hypothetical protein